MGNKTPHIYLISGLGADYKMFQKIKLDNYDFTHIEWNKPKSINQTISDYTKELLSQVKHENPILIGLSFGGIIAIEISKLIPISKLILISTIKTKYELPLLYRTVGFLGLNKITPEWLLNKNSLLLNSLIGIKSKEGEDIFRQIIKNADTFYLKWAINEMINWKHKSTIKNCIHIHGDSDKVFPISSNKVNYTIKNGSHFMIFEKAEEINRTIHNVI